jgi:sirohydrochlorin cobaltochelatase
MMEMKEVTLLVGHGSRDEDGNKEFIAFAELVKKAMPNREIETCFLELATPDIPTGISHCVERGATRIVVLPLILLAASHVKHEIPEFIDEAREQYPEIEFVYGRNVGMHERIIHLLADRFYEVMETTDGNSLDDTAIVLMGRGSSDVDANGNLYKISRLLSERVGISTVEVCFSGITYPSFPEGIKRAVLLGAKRIIVVPYFLFTGVLMKRMKGVFEELKHEYPDQNLWMAHHFGMHDDLVKAVVDRINEMDEMK